MAISVGTSWTVHAAVEAARTSSPAAACSRAFCARIGGRETASVCLRSTGLGTADAFSERQTSAGVSRHGRCSVVVSAKLMGEDPDWSDEDYIVLGLAHCFVKDEEGKLKDKFVVEGIAAGALECMDNGGTTCYKLVTGTKLGVALKQDLSLLPAEFAGAQFCDDFDFRIKCASRTWKRDHAQAHLLNLVPMGGVRSDFNFSLLDKRILNMENIVNDSDNVKQDMSIDVYGRKAEDNAAEDMSKEIASLYSV